MRNIRAVLFDFGGVLAEEGFSKGLEAIGRDQQLPVDDMTQAGMHAVYDSGYVTGQGTEEDFWTLLRERTGLHGDDAALTKTILDGFVVRPWILDLVQRLRSLGYVTGILSDQTDWLDRLDAGQHFYRCFDRVYNSYRLGKGKRDPSVFSDVAADLGLPPSQILFIDDNPNNVERARSAGMRGIHYRDRAGFLDELDRCLLIG